MKILLSFLPLVLGGIVYSRGVSAEIQSKNESGGWKLFGGLLLALVLVAISMLIQILWAREVRLWWDGSILLATLVALEYVFPAKTRLLRRNGFFRAAGIGIFLFIFWGLALLLMVFFEHAGML
ncbi:MAG: hypothetical protein ACR2OZ_17995 [Verrucomicrobiales bacterium]